MYAYACRLISSSERRDSWKSSLESDRSQTQGDTRRSVTAASRVFFPLLLLRLFMCNDEEQMMESMQSETLRVRVEITQIYIMFLWRRRPMSEGQ